MAAEGSIPTFKLVLVGDGGTGKVCPTYYTRPRLLIALSEALARLVSMPMRSRLEEIDS
jgi:hypothetical protein